MNGYRNKLNILLIMLAGHAGLQPPSLNRKKCICSGIESFFKKGGAKIVPEVHAKNAFLRRSWYEVV